jgi:excisionase family DNA binding protein
VTRLTVTVAEAATVLGVSRRLVYDAIARGELSAITIGRRLVIPRVSLEQLLGQSLEVTA